LNPLQFDQKKLALVFLGASDRNGQDLAILHLRGVPDSGGIMSGMVYPNIFGTPRPEKADAFDVYSAS
jgi:hypothetical protein